MAMSEREIQAMYDSSVPTDFEKQLLRREFGTYQAANLRCSDFPASEKHDLLPHVRRALFESDLRGAANAFGFRASPELNKTKSSYHTVVLINKIALTASTVASPKTIVRTALFRGALAASSQLNMYEAENGQEESLYLFAILLHGPNSNKPQQPGFCEIVFPNEDCDRYVYSINLFAKHKALIEELQTGEVEVIGDEVWPELRQDIPKQENEG